MDPDMPKGKLLRDSEGGDGENPGEKGGQPTLPVASRRKAGDPLTASRREQRAST